LHRPCPSPARFEPIGRFWAEKRPISQTFVTFFQTRRRLTVRDITERKAAERHLREQNDILTNSHEGVMIVNLANEVSLWNRGAEAIFGWTAAEALGRPPEKVLGVDDLGVMSTLRAAVKRDGFWNGELQSQTRDGRKLIVNSRVTLVRDEAGRPRALLSFLADITAEKLLEEKFLHVQRLENLGMLAAGACRVGATATASIAAEWRARGPEALAACMAELM